MINATCGYCGRKFAADDAQAGSHMTCPQCGAAATIPALPGLAPLPKSDAPNKLALWALMTGLASWLCACIVTPVSLILGFLALSRAHADPVHYAPARKRAIIGLCSAALAFVVWSVCFLAFGAHGLREEARAIAEGDAYYDRGDFAGAKRIYELHQTPTAREQKGKVRLRLGRIYAAEGRTALAQEMFRKALTDDPKLIFTCDDPDVQKLFDDVRLRR